MRHNPTFQSCFLADTLRRDKKQAMADCSHAELYVREAFLRTVHEIADGSGITESYSTDKLRGLLDFLEQWQFMEGDIERFKE